MSVCLIGVTTVAAGCGDHAVTRLGCGGAATPVRATADVAPSATAAVTAAAEWYSAVRPVVTPEQRKARDLGEPESVLPADAGREEALAYLLTTDTFAGTAVGYAGTTSSQVRAFARLLAEPRAAAVFEDLRRRAEPAGQLYALCGLYLTDRPKFEAVRGAYLKDGRRVRTLFGCLGMGATVESLAGGIANGSFPAAFEREAHALSAATTRPTAP